ncbi:MAG TPA: efflux RND transporter periplasmic adaptor subunit [Actinokineospora sp.]|nr:efflux RND transporter periplasmic adaptor subunit [Actinokineospora sp.]
MVVLLAAAATAYFWLRGGTASEATAPRTVAAGLGAVTQTVSAAGTIESASTSTADFAGSGTVSEILVKVGDQVTVGQALARLDDADAASAVDVAEDQRDAAQYNLTAAQTKLSDTLAAGQDATQARAGVKQQEAALKQQKTALAAAQKKLAGTTLTAPTAGTVVAVNGTVGATAGSTGGSSASAGAATGFIQIADLATLRVRTSLAEVDVAKVKVGQPATVTVNAIPAAPVDGKVESIDPVPTTANNVVTFGAIIAVGKLPDGARSGQTVSVSVTVAQVDNVVVLPSAAVQTADGTSYVTVLDNGTQSRRTVRIGVKGDSTVEVAEGVAAGDQIVLPGAAATSGTRGTGGTSPFGGGGVPGGTGGRQNGQTGQTGGGR